MKKLFSTSIIFISATVLVACSNNKTTTSENKEQPKTEQSTSIEQTKAKNSQYKEVTSLLKGRLNSGETEAATISIENHITTPDNAEPHDNIKISLIGQTKESTHQSLDALNAHSAIRDQNNDIVFIRMSISEFAKQLPDDKTTITIGYEKADGQFEIVGKSSKEKDFIPIGEFQ